MRIKEACELTGLTDKAIRVYINNELISPAYTENYMGRKNYSFDENDIELLNKISLLRKFDFSINEIKILLTDIAAVEDIIEERIAEIKSTANKSTLALNCLLDVSIKNCKSIDDLCLALNESQAVNIKKDEATEDLDIKKLIRPYVKKAKTKAPKFIMLSLLAIVLGIIIMGLIIFACVMLFMKL